MFVDDYGREFKNEDEIKACAEKEFFEDEEAFIDSMADEVTVEELLEWILKNNKEKFIKDYQTAIRWAKTTYVHKFPDIHDIEEI